MNTVERLVEALREYLLRNLGLSPRLLQDNPRPELDREEQEQREALLKRVAPVQKLQLDPQSFEDFPYIVYERTGQEGTPSFSSVHPWGERFTISVIHDRYLEAYNLANGIGPFLKEKGMAVSATFDVDDYDSDVEAYECGVSVVLQRRT